MKLSALIEERLDVGIADRSALSGSALRAFSMSVAGLNVFGSQFASFMAMYLIGSAALPYGSGP
jgi:hypothetical protein